MIPFYDVIVVGGGHAGCEAAAAAANLGSKTLLITMDMTKYAQMSCNPAMGGIAKGQIIREIDALGGYSGIIADQSTIQFRMLNKSKGPAMWSPRSQNDRFKFVELWRDTLESIETLDLWQDSVTNLIIEDKVVKGVKTKMGVDFNAKTVILANGTFLNGLMHVGIAKMKGGRIGEAASYNISEQLAELGFKTGRLKTGTPVRIDGRTIDFSVCAEQKGDVGKTALYGLKTVGGLTGRIPNQVIRTGQGIYDIHTGEADDLRRLIYSDWSLTNYGWPGGEEKEDPGFI